MLLYEHLSLSESDKDSTQSDKDSTQFAHGLSKGARQPYQRPNRKTAHQKWIAQEKAPPCRNRPLARSARRYKGVIGESKEGIGGTRNPPCPPWPPEAPKIKGKIKDYHLRNPNARKNRTLELRRIQECIERSPTPQSPASPAPISSEPFERMPAVCKRGGIPYAVLDIHGDSLKLSIGDLGCNRAEENIWSFR